MTEIARESVADRYGVRRSKRADRRVGWILGGIGVLLGAFVLVFGSWSSNTTSFQDISFQVHEPTADGVHTASARFQVTSEPGVRVSCAVEALNSSKGTIGWKVVDLPVDDSLHHTVTADIVTLGPAVTAYAKSCWKAEQ